MRPAILLCAALMLVFGTAAGAGTVTTAHGQLIHVRANTNESSNWFGYNLGALANGDTLFNSITGD